MALLKDCPVRTDWLGVLLSVILLLVCLYSERRCYLCRDRRLLVDGVVGSFVLLECCRSLLWTRCLVYSCLMERRWSLLLFCLLLYYNDRDRWVFLLVVVDGAISGVDPLRCFKQCRWLRHSCCSLECCRSSLLWTCCLVSSCNDRVGLSSSLSSVLSLEFNAELRTSSSSLLRRRLFTLNVG